jgi:glutathione synthase/RimK-type ligase-like ATP-grasp enzyme
MNIGPRRFRRCVFLTMEDPTGFYIYDYLAFKPLKELGWLAEEIPWSRDGVKWSRYDAVVIRSTWDYQSDADRFLDVLAEIDRQGPRLLNPLSICRWNMHKSYLRDLQERGVPIVPTAWRDRLDESVLDGLADELQSERLVVKPVVGANADDTYRLERRADTAHRQAALRVFADRPLMAQPFIDSICDAGELSLFYFAGHYSHAIAKTPQAGDFRVQEEHGGRIESTFATPDVLRAAERVMQSIGQTLLYARVDLVRLPDGTLALMELELIEPSLYFPYHEPAPRLFAQAFHDLMALPTP